MPVITTALIVIISLSVAALGWCFFGFLKARKTQPFVGWLVRPRKEGAEKRRILVEFSRRFPDEPDEPDRRKKKNGLLRPCHMSRNQQHGWASLQYA